MTNECCPTCGRVMPNDENPIRRARKMRGISVADACQASGIALAQWYQYERGGSIPSLLTAKKIADALGCAIEALIPNDAA